jgi:phosphoserine phosphatase RsbU/P
LDDNLCRQKFMMTTQKNHTPLALIADDDRSTRIILRIILQRDGYEVVEVEDGAQCLTAFSQRKPDIVLLDAQMPIMDGFECCKRLKQMPLGDRTPVMMITGLQTPQDMDQAFQAGVIDFVTKPIHPPLLSRRLRYILKSSQADIALRDSEERYRSVVDNLKEVIFQTDREGTLSFLNPAWVEVTGFSSEQSLGQPFFQFIYPDDSQALRLQFQQIFLGQLSECRVEVRFLTLTGIIGWMEIYICALVSQKGTATGILGSFNNITERKGREVLDKLERSAVQVLAESRTLTEAVPSLLQAVGNAMTWEYGEFWMMNAQSHQLECAQRWYKDSDRSIYKDFQLNLDIEFIQTLWENGGFACTSPLPILNEEFNAAAAQLELQSAVSFPILGGYERLGMVVFLRRSPLITDALLFQSLDGIGSQIGAFVLHKLAEIELQQYHQRMSQELSQAADYVGALLPPNLSGEVSINHLFRPSNDLGGDVFDYYWLDSDHLVIYLLDVAGHGVQSALLSISVLNVMRSRALQTNDFSQPAKILQELNRTFQMGTQGDDYFTLWYGVYSKVDQTLTYASAGHPPALLVQPDHTVQQLNVGGIAIGLMPEMIYEQGCCPIKVGSCLYIFSDGVYEVNQANGKLWDFEAFVDLISAHQQQQPINHLESIYTQICNVKNSNTFDDDFSLIQIDFNMPLHSKGSSIEKIMALI